MSKPTPEDECLTPAFLDALLIGCVGEKLTAEERYEIVVALRLNLIWHMTTTRASGGKE